MATAEQQDRKTVREYMEAMETVTDGVAEHLEIRRNRELEAVYPVVCFDALMVKIRRNGDVANRSLHLALAINRRARRGCWASGRRKTRVQSIG